MRIMLSAVLAVSAGPVFARTVCDDLWFARNLIYDRAGYCFSSDLGRAVFDNAGCTPGAVTLTGAAARDVQTIQAYEAELVCHANTSRHRLDLPHLEARMMLVDLPVPSLHESACYGWRGSDVTLRAGRDETAAVTGTISAGDDIIWTHEGSDDWSFVVMQDGSGGMGWFPDMAMTAADCTTSAG